MRNPAFGPWHRQDACAGHRQDACATGRSLSGIILLVIALAGPAFAVTYINVQGYGAMGDGSTDDTLAIQSALLTGQPVYFPKTASFYKVSDRLRYSGQRIVSDGARIRATDTDFLILQIESSSGTYVGDLRLEYPAEQALRSGTPPLQLLRCSDFIVERVIGVNGGPIRAYYSTNGIIRDCQMLTASYNAFSVRSSSGIVVENCYAEKCVSAFAAEDSKHVRIVNNTAEDAYLGMRIEDSEDVLVEGNVLRYCRQGLSAYGPHSASGVLTTDLVFRGNTLYHCYKTIHVDKVDPYINHVGEFALASKMHVGDVLYDNNIVIGRDESTLLTDLSSNVVFNSGAGLDAAWVAEDTSGNSYYTLVPYVKFVYIGKQGGQMPTNWLFYVNFPQGVDMSAEDVMTADFYWGGTCMDEGTMAVNLYSGLDRTGFICQIPLYNPYQYISLPVILYVRDGADASDVKCIEFERIGGTCGASVLNVSELRKGLQSKIGYLHSYYHSEPADGVSNAVVSSNVFVDVALPYVDRKRVPAYPATIIEGPGVTGTTAQRPADPPLGRRYYDTDLSATVYWNGHDWVDIGTYCQGSKVKRAVHLDGSNPVTLRPDDTAGMDNYTIEAWIRPTTGGTGDRHIIQRFDIATPSGYLMQLWSSDELYGYQSVGDDFYAVIVHAPFPHDGEFHHVAFTFSYDGATSTAKLYIDGEPVDTASVTGAPDHPAQDVELMSGNGFTGTIDGLNIYTRVLTDEEIGKSYERFAGSVYAYWRFNEGAGTQTWGYSPYASEGTSNWNVGVLTGMDPVQSWVDGKAGTALDFARTGYVDFGTNEWLNSVTNYTLTAWVKPDTSGIGDRHIIQRFDIAAPSGYLMQLWTSDELYGYQSVGGYFYAVMVRAAFPHDGEFHHVALTFSYDGATSAAKLYIDGGVVDAASATGAPDLPAEDIVLKCGNGFEGILDEIKFHTRALSDAEVAAEYATGEFFDRTFIPGDTGQDGSGMFIIVR